CRARATAREVHFVACQFVRPVQACAGLGKQVANIGSVSKARAPELKTCWPSQVLAHTSSHFQIMSNQSDHRFSELLRRIRKWRAFAGASVAEPLFPYFGVVRPFLQLNAPQRGFEGQEERAALPRCQAAGHGCFGMRY